MEWITTSTTNIMTVFSSLLTVIEGNELLAMLFVAGTALPLGFGLLHHFKGAAH